jgi:hypothetical protein
MSRHAKRKSAALQRQKSEGSLLDLDQGKAAGCPAGVHLSPNADTGKPSMNLLSGIAPSRDCRSTKLRSPVTRSSFREPSFPRRCCTSAWPCHAHVARRPCAERAIAARPPQPARLPCASCDRAAPLVFFAGARMPDSRRRSLARLSGVIAQVPTEAKSTALVFGNRVKDR